MNSDYKSANDKMELIDNSNALIDISMTDENNKQECIDNILNKDHIKKIIYWMKVTINNLIIM